MMQPAYDLSRDRQGRLAARARPLQPDGRAAGDEDQPQARSHCYLEATGSRSFTWQSTLIGQPRPWDGSTAKRSSGRSSS